MFANARLRSTLLAVACCGALAFQAGAQEARQVDVPEGDLAVALQQYVRQTGIELVYRPEQVKGLRTQGVRGVLAPEQALQKLIEGTSLELRKDSSGVLLISQPSGGASKEVRGTPGADLAGNARTLDTVNVFGTLDDNVSVGSKVGLSLKDTPKSVTIVNRERIEAQNLTTVTDVLNQATGITLQSYDVVQPLYYSRGFRVETMQVDGGAPTSRGFGYIASPDSAKFEHVEVLRGVDGIFSGAGDPGGVINMVRKGASSTPGTTLNVSVGRWNNYRAELDVAGALTQSGRVRGRAVGVYEDKEYFWDRADSNKKMLYGVVEFDLGEETLLSLGGSHETRRENGYWAGGIGRYADGTDLKLPRNVSLTADWTYADFVTKEVFAKLERRFGNDTVFRVNVTHELQDTELTSMYIKGGISPVTGQGATATAWADDLNSTRTMVDAYLSGRFDLFGREHSYAIGSDFSKRDGGGKTYYDLVGYPWVGGPSVDVFNFDPSLLPQPARVLNPDMSHSISPVYDQYQRGLYATIGAQLTDSLKLIAGARYSRYKQRELTYWLNPDGSRSEYTSYYAPIYKDQALVPSLALTYAINADWSAYASYGESFRPQASLLRAPLPGTSLDAITGAGYEMGIKGIMFDAVNASVALYRVERNGEGVQDPAYPYIPGDRGSACCYLAQGDVTTQGLDLEFSGRVLRGLQVFAGYTFTSTDNNTQAGSTFTATEFSVTPKHLFKMWATWSLPGALSDWTLSAGVNAQTQYTKLGTAADFDAVGNITGYRPYRMVQAGYALWNASVQYRINSHWSAALYVENLFDKTYYSTLGYVDWGSIYGTPRNVVLRVQTRF